MPNIREFNVDPREAKLIPSEVGINALNQAGEHAASMAYRIQNFYDRAGASIGGGIADIGKALDEWNQKHAGADEISKGQNLATTMMLNSKLGVTQDVKNDSLDPQKSIDDFNTQVDNARSNFKTKEGIASWERQSQRLKDEHTSYVMSMAGAKNGLDVENNLKQSENNLAAALDLDHSPAAIQHALDTWGGMVKDQINARPNLTGASALKAQELVGEGQGNLVNHALKSWATQDPQEFQKQWDSGALDNFKQYLKPNEQIDLPKLAQSSFNSQMLEKQRVEKAEFNKATAEIYNKDTYWDPKTQSVRVSPYAFQHLMDASKMAGADPQQIETVQRALTQMQKDAAEGRQPDNDPSAVKGLTDKLYAGTLKDIDIWTARRDSLINDKEMKFFQEGLTASGKDLKMDNANKQFSDWFNTHVRDPLEIMPQGGKSIIGAARANDLERLLHEQFMQGYNSGIPVNELLQIDAPKGILSSKTLQMYKPTTDDWTKEKTGNYLPGASIETQTNKALSIQRQAEQSAARVRQEAGRPQGPEGVTASPPPPIPNPETNRLGPEAGANNQTGNTMMGRGLSNSATILKLLLGK